MHDVLDHMFDVTFWRGSQAWMSVQVYEAHSLENANLDLCGLIWERMWVSLWCSPNGRSTWIATRVNGLCCERMMLHILEEFISLLIIFLKKSSYCMNNKSCVLMGVSVDNGPRQGLDKFLKAASDDPDTVLHYEFMQDYKVLLCLFIFQTLMSGRGNERKLLKLKHEVFYAAQVNTI